jgi:regulator of sirC expression with transglutaminase-like and TPR domain
LPRWPETLAGRDAANRKDLDKAVDEYDKALTVAPCWAEGRRQDALLEGQTRWYFVAVQDMKKYLLLYPDAPNAQAVRDKILIWNGRMGVE